MRLGGLYREWRVVAERAYLVDTPVFEFSATYGVLASGRASGVNLVRGEVIPPSGLRCASSIIALFNSILMILTYPTQNLVKKRQKKGIIC